MFSRAIHNAFFLFLLLILPSLSARADEPEPDLLARASALEDQDQLAEALKLLGPANLKPEEKEHRQKLEAVVRASRSVKVYVKWKEFEKTRSTLRELLLTLDPLRDAALLGAVQRMLVVAEEQARETADNLATHVLEKAEAQLGAKKFDEALASFSDVLSHKPGELSEALVRRAAEGKLLAETASLKAQNPALWLEIWNTLVKDLATVVPWLACVLVAVIVVRGISCLPKLLPARKGLALSLADLTAAKEDRTERSMDLMREMANRLRGVGQADDSIVEIDRYEDLDSASVGTLRVQGAELESLESLIDDTAMHVGVLSFSPRRLFSFLRTALRRPFERTLVGTLAKRGDKTTLSVELVGPDGQPVSGMRWEREGADDARGDMVRQAATHIAFDLAEYRLTPSWRSFASYREGTKWLSGEGQAADRNACLKSACEVFRQSLHFDPANWMARFNLATALRKKGENETAAEQFAFLARMLDGEGARGDDPLARFLGRHPCFPDVVRYNLAVALSKSVDRGDQNKAQRGLRDLIDKMVAAAEAREREAVDRTTAAQKTAAEATAAAEAAARKRKAEQDSQFRAHQTSAVLMQKRLAVVRTGRQAAGPQRAATAVPSDIAKAERDAREARQAAEQATRERRQAEKTAVNAAAEAAFATAVAAEQTPRAAARRERALYWLARSALAATLAADLDYLRDEHGDEDRLNAHRRQLFAEVEELWKWVENLPLASQSADLQTYVVVQSVIRNAYGRACFQIGRHRAALQALSSVVHTSPDFLDAYINLAEVCLAVKDRFYTEWTSRTKEILDQAIVLSPSHQKAHYLLAKVHAQPGVEDFPKAMEELEKAGAHPANDSLRAEILRSQGKLPEAIAVLRKSLVRFPKPDYRFALCVECLLRPADGQPPGHDVLAEAKRIAKRLKEAGTRPRFKKWGERLLARIESLAGPSSGKSQEKASQRVAAKAAARTRAKRPSAEESPADRIEEPASQ